MRFMLVFCVCYTWGISAGAQDVEEVRQRAVEAVRRIAGVNAMTITADLTCKDEIQPVEGEVKAQVRGKERRLSFDTRVLYPAGSYNESVQARLRNARGSDLPTIFSFDGRMRYSYEPGGLALFVEPAAEFSGPRWASPLFPENWVCFNGFSAATFEVFLTGDDAAVATPPVSDQPRRFVKEFSSEKKMAFDKLEFLVDPKCGFHVIEYSTEGGALGDSHATLNWVQEKGSWFPKQMHFEDYRGFVVDCEVTHVDFSAASVVDSFSISDSDLPTGTRVQIKQLASNKKANEHFVGGNEGAIEHKLRQPALAKLRKEIDK